MLFFCGMFPPGDVVETDEVLASQGEPNISRKHIHLKKKSLGYDASNNMYISQIFIADSLETLFQ